MRISDIEKMMNGPADGCAEVRLDRHAGRHLTGCFCLFLLMMYLGVDVASAGDYKVRRKTADYTVDATINRNPPVLGHNALRVEITDRQGSYVTDAVVRVNYYMPPMPGMAPMNYTVVAAGRGRGYETVMDLIMTGPWIIVIRVEARGNVWRVTFPIDVR
jgi:hypothetical protein